MHFQESGFFGLEFVRTDFAVVFGSQKYLEMTKDHVERSSDEAAKFNQTWVDFRKPLERF